MTIRRPIKKEELKKEELAGVAGGIVYPYFFCAGCKEIFSYGELDTNGYCKDCAAKHPTGGATGSW